VSVSQRVRLLRHPRSAVVPALEIEADVARDASALLLMYVVRGDIAAVSLPEPTAPARADGLWQHTCFEAFIRGGRSEAYWEFNFSPSREWAAYRFEAYREGMTVEIAIADPYIESLVDGSGLRLSATLDLSGIAALASSEDWQVGLSAVVEDQSGGKSFFALAHPPGKPDFHHAESFALCL
jgi:hypothetical protein